MCFNAAMMAGADVLEELYGASVPASRFDVPTRFASAFAHPVWPVLRQGYPGAFHPMAWGLVPAWTKSAADALSIRDKTLNARWETIASKPSFRSLVDRRRCAVPVDGFVEWRLHDRKKYPYHIAMPGKQPFMLAGLWDRWADPESDTVLESFTVITTEAKGLPALVHNTKLRMPFILGRNGGAAWLDSDIPFAECGSMMNPIHEPLEAWPVSREVSRPGVDKNVPGIQDPVEYPELPPL